MKVLIVDDEEEICKRLQRELQKEGCEVEYTTSPVGLIARLQNAKTEGGPYELVLLDIRMPKVSGFELLEEIRESGLDLDVIIITGYGDEEKAVEAIRLGAADYLVKPISLDELQTAIFRVRQKRAGAKKATLRHRILVVDDEEYLCRRIKRELEKEGYPTAVAYDGEEGLDYFKNNRVHVVIADIRMPGMSGLEMLEQCREIADDFVSIIVTGHGDHETAIEALKLGVLNYLKKPLSLEELVVSVNRGIDLLLLRRGLSARTRELEIETAVKEQYARNLEKMVEERTEELKKYSERLEEMVEDRTKDLREAQERLVRQEKLAVLGQLAGGMSHELRNPLGAIKNAAYFLNIVLEKPQPEVKETLEILEKEVAMSEKIITSLFDFAHARSPRLRQVDINDLVQEALSRAAIPENVKVVNQLDETLPTILADHDQVAQIFGNLILNAIQAMSTCADGTAGRPEGGRLVVKTSASSVEPSEVASPKRVAISFADAGMGISEENLEKIFEPLFTTKAKGIGLGLAVTRTMVEAHGGSIEVASEVGKGSTFTVRLPIKD